MAGSSLRFALGLALTVLGQPRAASAHPPILTWEAPAECPKKEEVARAIANLAPGHVDDGDHLFRVQIAQAAENSWTAQLSTETSSTTERAGAQRAEIEGPQRVLRGASCEEVTQAAIAVLALTLTPQNETEDTANTPEDNPSLDDNSLLPDEKKRRKSLGLPSAFRQPWLLRAGFGLELLTLPRVAPTFALAAGIPLGPVLVKLGGSYALPQSVPSSSADGEDPAARMELWLGELSLCSRYWGTRFFAGACAAGSAGVLPARGLSANGKRSWGRVVAVGAELELGLRAATNWAFTLGAAAQVHLLRDRFNLLEGQIYQVPSLLLRPQMSVEWQFW